MKTIYAIWFWHVGCPPKEEGKTPWTVKPFGSESKARTWVSHNFYLMVSAVGGFCEVESEADIPSDPPESARLLVGTRKGGEHHRCGKYPVVEKPVENHFNLHRQRTVQDEWRHS